MPLSAIVDMILSAGNYQVMTAENAARSACDFSSGRLRFPFNALGVSLVDWRYFARKQSLLVAVRRHQKSRLLTLGTLSEPTAKRAFYGRTSAKDGSGMAASAWSIVARLTSCASTMAP
jgi:hypothetical protein